MSAPQALIRELAVPGEVLRRLAQRHPERYPVLLDSAAEGPLSRMSILAAYPRASLWQRPDRTLEASGVQVEGRQFLPWLERWWKAERTEAQGELAGLPFTGGWFVFLSYELADEIEPSLTLPASDLPWRAFALRVPCALIHERSSDRVLAVAEPGEAGVLDLIEADARGAGQGVAPAATALSARIIEEPAALFLERVRAAQEYIRAGDIYQANLSRPWHVELAGDVAVAELYERLCAANPAPFAALAQWQGVSILSSSPERLVSLAADGLAQTRPIAGTRPRSRRPGGDAAEMSELAAHPKERAEHVMLVDLERNDLGRVCRAGSVRVDEMMSIESYAHVHHIVSNVRGMLREDATPVDLIRAVFPGGTITGCPKVRCMQIIAELEAQGRGAYTGSLGFLGRDGRMDLNILIRTMSVRGRKISFRAGGGIVADSIADRELEETRAKARGLLALFTEASVAA